MSEFTWVEEPGTGRYFYEWEDDHGRTHRKYHEEEGEQSTSYQGPSSQEYERTPRSESRHEKTRGDPSRRAERNLKHHDNKGKTEPIPIRKNSSTKYHEPGGYSSSRGREGYGRSEQYGSPQDLKNFEPSSPHSQVGGSTEPRGNDGSDPSIAGPLASEMSSLTMDEVVGEDGYAISTYSSAPTMQSQWKPVSGTQGASANTIYENDKEESQWYPAERKGQQYPTGMKEGNIHAQSSSPGTIHGDTSARHAKGKETANERPEVFTATPRYIAGTPGKTETLDSSYKVRKRDYKKFFKPGRIFMTLWTDAYSEATNESEINQFMSEKTFTVKYNERVISKIRRFVVVKQRDRYCQCLPVTTYDGQGHRKQGINLDEHGQIYSGEKRPKEIDGIKKKPLRVVISKGAKNLTNSFINYGRVYTVETNVKVKEVGDLDQDSKKLLRHYYKKVNFSDDEDDYAGTAPPDSASSRELQFAGVGGGLTGEQSYSEDPSSGYTTSPTFNTSNPTSTGYEPSSGYMRPMYSLNNSTTAGQGPSAYNAHTGGQSYAQPAMSTYSIQSTAQYQTPGFGSNVAQSSVPAALYNSGALYRNDYYQQPQYPPSNSGSYPAPLGSMNSPSQYYPSGAATGQNQQWASPPIPSPSTGQPSQPETEEQINLPTLGEARAAKSSRRPSMSSNQSRSHGARTRDREKESKDDQGYGREYERRSK